VFLPPDWPELNLIERVWRALKDDLAWQPISNMDGQQDYMSQWWRTYDVPTWLMRSMH
jgi:transposase